MASTSESARRTIPRSQREPWRAVGIGEGRSERLLYLDNLKTFFVAGVLVAHAATHYLGGGAWVDNEDLAGKGLIVLFGLIGLVGGLFWIGLFFLVSGMLAPRSLRSNGLRQFLTSRLLRLGVPLAVYIVLVQPVLRYVIFAWGSAGRHDSESMWLFLAKRIRDVDPGPLWFVGVLLAVSGVYTVWWRYWPRSKNSRSTLRWSYLTFLAVTIAASSFAVRFFWPLFSHNFLDLHLWQWPQYVALFWFGAMGAERGWFIALPHLLWRRCGWVALAAAAAVPILAAAGGALSGQTQEFSGGWHWQAAVMTVAEAMLAVFGSLWVLDFFRRVLDRQGELARRLTRCSYSAYVVHAPLVVAFSLALTSFRLPVEINLILLAIATVTASFGLAWLLVIKFRFATRIL